MKKKLLSMALFFLNGLFCVHVCAAPTPALYDDFNDNALDQTKWLVEPSAHAGAVAETNGTLAINGAFDQGQGVQAYVLGPDKSFDGLEATIKLSSATGLVLGFGINAHLWSDGIFDHKATITFPTFNN